MLAGAHLYLLLWAFLITPWAADWDGLILPYLGLPVGEEPPPVLLYLARCAVADQLICPSLPPAQYSSHMKYVGQPYDSGGCGRRSPPLSHRPGSDQGEGKKSCTPTNLHRARMASMACDRAPLAVHRSPPCLRLAQAIPYSPALFRWQHARMSVHVSTHTSACRYVHVSERMPAYMCTDMSVHMSAHMPAHMQGKT